MKMTKRALAYVFLIIMAALFVLPILATFVSSFMGQKELESMYAAGAVPHLIPRRFTLEGYKKLIFSDGSYLRMFWNSMLLAAAAALGSGVVGVMVGYMLSRINFRGRGGLKLIYIIVMMMPFQVTTLPNYIVLRNVGLLDTFWALLLPSVFAPLGVFLMTQYYRGVSMDEIRAARIDNATLPRFLGRIIVPRVWPGVAACLLLSFAEAWNMVEQPLVFLSTPSLYPLSMAFSGDTGAAGSTVMFAGAVLYMIPVILLFFIFRDELVNGVGSAGI